MSDSIHISIDRSNFTCTVDINKLARDKRDRLRFILMNRWEDISFNREFIRLPFYQLKRSLQSIIIWAKSCKTDILFDDDTKKYLDLYARDKRAYKGYKSGHLANIQNIQVFLTDKGFNRILTTRQVEDVTTLLELAHGANFSVPGAGKTTSLLAVFTILKYQSKVDKLLVVCPINAFISWETEIYEIFGGRLKVQRLSKEYISEQRSDGLPKADVYLSNYEKYRSEIGGILQFISKNKLHLVLDESHRIKAGFSNQSYPQLIEIGDASFRRDIMSGTPMPQSPKDIESQFEFLWPTEKIIPTEKSDNQELTAIHNNIKNLFVRTTKHDLRLEPVRYLNTKVEMGPVQQELYNLIRSESSRILSGMDRDNLVLFRAMGRCVVRLMQASTNPMLLSSNEDMYDEKLGFPESSDVWNLLEEYGRIERPSKFIILEKRINEILSQGQETKVLIWTFFVKNILLLKNDYRNLNPAVIYGGVSSSGDDSIEESREGQIKKFHEDPSCRIMIANPQACGEGISLHRVCHHAIYLDRNYNAAHYLQSMDRIHRFGLEPGTTTTIEILEAQKSLDQRIDSRLRSKIEALSAILDDGFFKINGL